jgi:GDP-mannose 6-dehydrogenase
MHAMNVSIFGLGYVGSVTAACLASWGHKVFGVDVNPDKVDAINNGRSPIIEPGLHDLICDGVRAGNLRATCDATEAIAHGAVVLVCVGTPSDERGNLNFQYVDRVCTEIAHALSATTEYKLIVLRSTLLPGTLSSRLIPLLTRKSGKQAGRDIGVAVNPEFLREGSAIDDFENPPFTLIGQMDERGGDVLEELYASIPAPVFRTDPDTACMVKYASNAFHGLKVAFANEIGQLCKRLGVDGTEVMEIFCQDRLLNISPRYLRPGFAFGGSCLPKDLRALLYLARHRDLELPVLESILPSNRLQIQRAVDLVLRDQRRNVGIIGLTFKPGTDDLRESPLVELVEVLSGKGLQVRIYDDNVSLSRLVGGNKAFIERVIPHIAGLMCTSMEEVVKGSEIIVVAHDCCDGRERLFDLLEPDQLVIDLVKIVPRFGRLPVTYEGICW